MTRVVSVSISGEMWDLAKSSHIKWSEALRRGIREMANDPMPEFEGEIIEKESQKSIIVNLQKQNKILQETILKLGDGVKDVVEEEFDKELKRITSDD